MASAMTATVRGPPRQVSAAPLRHGRRGPVGMLERDRLSDAVGRHGRLASARRPRLLAPDGRPRPTGFGRAARVARSGRSSKATRLRSSGGGGPAQLGSPGSRGFGRAAMAVRRVGLPGLHGFGRAVTAVRLIGQPLLSDAVGRPGSTGFGQTASAPGTGRAARANRLRSDGQGRALGSDRQGQPAPAGRRRWFGAARTAKANRLRPCGGGGSARVGRPTPRGLGRAAAADRRGSGGQEAPGKPLEWPRPFDFGRTSTVRRLRPAGRCGPSGCSAGTSWVGFGRPASNRRSRLTPAPGFGREVTVRRGAWSLRVDRLRPDGRERTGGTAGPGRERVRPRTAPVDRANRNAVSHVARVNGKKAKCVERRTALNDGKALKGWNSMSAPA